MNKGILYVGILLVMIASVFANGEKTCPEKGIGSIDCECEDPFNGFGDGWYGAAKWSCDNGVWTSEDEVITGTSVTGDCDSAEWSTLGTEADGIVIKAGNENDASDGVHYTVLGTSGTADEDKDLSHITFCYENGGSNGGGNGGGNNVPEFSTITLGLAIVGAGLGLAFMRKQH